MANSTNNQADLIKNNSELEAQLSKKMNDTEKKAVEKAFELAVGSIENNIAEKLKLNPNAFPENQRDLILDVIKDILDGDDVLDKTRIASINDLLWNPQNNLDPYLKEQIAWLYGYAIEIDALDTSYKKELGKLISRTSDVIAKLFQTFPEKKNSNIVKWKFHMIKDKSNKIQPQVIKVDNRVLDDLRNPNALSNSMFQQEKNSIASEVLSDMQSDFLKNIKRSLLVNSDRYNTAGGDQKSSYRTKIREDVYRLKVFMEAFPSVDISSIPQHLRPDQQNDFSDLTMTKDSILKEFSQSYEKKLQKSLERKTKNEIPSRIEHITQAWLQWYQDFLKNFEKADNTFYNSEKTRVDSLRLVTSEYVDTKVQGADNVETLKKDPNWGKIITTIKKTYDIDEKDFSTFMNAARYVNIGDVISIVDTYKKSAGWGIGSELFAKKLPENYKSTWKRTFFKTERALAYDIAKIYETNKSENFNKFLGDVLPILESSSVTNAKVLWENIARVTKSTHEIQKVGEVVWGSKLALLLGDLDANLSVDKKDQWQKTWQAIVTMYETAKAWKTEEVVVGNIKNFLIWIDSTLEGWLKNIQNDEASLVGYFVKTPVALSTIRKQLSLLGTNASLMFQEWANIGGVMKEQSKDKVDMMNAFEKKLQSALEVNKEKIAAQYDATKTAIEQKMNEFEGWSNERNQYNSVLDSLKNQREENLKVINVAAVAAWASMLNEKFSWAWLAFALDSPKFNARLSENTNNIISNIAVVPWVGLASGDKVQPVWVMWVSIWWGKVFTTENRGLSAINWGSTISTWWLSLSFIRTKETNKQETDKDLEASAEYLNYWITFVRSWSGNMFAVAQAWWSRDRQNKIIEHQNILKTNVDLQKLIWWVLKNALITVDANEKNQSVTTKEQFEKNVYETLEKKVFSKTKDKQMISALAKKIVDATAPYVIENNTLKNIHNQQVDIIVHDIANNIALTYRNEQVMWMNKVEVNGLNLAVAIPVWSNPIAMGEAVLLSILSSVPGKVNKAPNRTEDAGSLRKAQNIIDYGLWAQEYGAWSDIKTLEGFNRLWKYLQKNTAEGKKVDLFGLDDQHTFVTIHKEAFKHMNIAIDPSLRQYIYLNQDGNVVIPAVPTTYAQLARWSSSIDAMIFWKTWLAGTDLLKLTDVTSTSPEKNFEKKDLITENSLLETMQHELTRWVLTPIQDKIRITGNKVEMYIDDQVCEPISLKTPDGSLIKSWKMVFTNNGSGKPLFYEYIKTNDPLKIEYKESVAVGVELPDVDSIWKTFLDQPKIEARLLSMKENYNVDYRKFQSKIYGWEYQDALAYAKKMFANSVFAHKNIDTLIDQKALNYIKSLDLTGENKEIAKASLNYLNGKLALTPSTWGRGKDISSYLNSGDPILKWRLSKAKQEAYKNESLQKLVDARLSWGKYDNKILFSLTNMLKKEWLSDVAQESLLENRANALWDISNTKTYTSEKLDNAIALVFWYWEQVNERWTGHPQLARNEGVSYESEISNSEIKDYFVGRLSPEYLETIKTSIVKQYGNGLSVDKISNENLTKALLDGKLHIEDVFRKAQTIELGTEFVFAFYAECFNESIVLKNITVKKENSRDVKVEDVIMSNTQSTSNQASRGSMARWVAASTTITGKIDGWTDTGQQEVISETMTWELVEKDWKRYFEWKDANGNVVSHELTVDNWKLYLLQWGDKQFVGDIPTGVPDLFDLTDKTTKVSITTKVVTELPPDLLDNTMTVEQTDKGWMLTMYHVVADGVVAKSGANK